MKVLIMGAGGQGGPCASILARDKEVTEIVVADINVEAAEKVKQRVNSPKIKVMQVDAASPNEVAKAAEGMDVIIDVVLPFLAPNVMRGALEAGAHYVNTAFDTPFWNQLVNGEPLEMHEEFKEAGLTALLGCGMSPGFLNVLVRYYADKLDTIKSIKLRLGKKNISLGKYADITAPWNPGWSPKQALIDCATKPHVFRNGKYEQLEPYAEIEEWQFPEPIGKLLVSHHSHEEPYSLPRTLGKGLEYCDFKYYVSYQPAALVSMGLASQEEIDINGTKIKPIDVVTALIPKPGNAFLEEDVEKLDILDKTSFVSMMIEMTGTKNNAPVTYRIHCPKMTAPGRKLYELFGTSFINVALPAVIGAKMVIEGAEKGVIFPEQLDPNKFLALFKASGIPYQWEEL
ncbi:MAG TPA: hypothetical protein GX503_05345 [Clostridiales bacterium]|nr:hypothetical protein [Clostridiales bacterium]